MGWRALFSPRGARRRLIAIAAVALVALAAGAIVAAGHNHTSKKHRHSPLARQGRSGGQRQPNRASHAGWRPHRGPVPILMYHVIEKPRPGVRDPLLYVSGRTFAAQMRWLDRHGFEGVTLDQVEEAWRGRGLLPRRPIVVSFDDGYASQYRTAMPILRSHHWPGVLSLCIGNMKHPGAAITPAQVQRLVDAGWELASHTISHMDLRSMTGRRLRREVWDSRRIIRYVFRVPVDNFTYPSGLYDAATIRALERAGYRGALTVTPGLANRHEPFQLRRIRVVDDMRLSGLADELKSLGV
jgi:peptidoglycan/xylan/chitin deacetylase (PgdA/CDA1 family)